jgi:hypothetical protein
MRSFLTSFETTLIVLVTCIAGATTQTVSQTNDPPLVFASDTSYVAANTTTAPPPPPPPPPPYCLTCIPPPNELLEKRAAQWDLGSPRKDDSSYRGYVVAKKIGDAIEFSVNATVPKSTTKYSMYLVDPANDMVVEEYPVIAKQGRFKATFKTHSEALTILISPKFYLKTIPTEKDVVIASALPKSDEH